MTPIQRIEKLTPPTAVLTILKTGDSVTVVVADGTPLTMIEKLAVLDLAKHEVLTNEAS